MMEENTKTSWNKGIKLSEVHKKKLSEARQRYFKNGGVSPTKGRKLSAEKRREMSEIGKRLWENEEYAKHMSEVHKGKPSGNKGKKNSEETRKKCSLANIGIRRSPSTEFKKGQTSWNKGKKNPALSERNKGNKYGAGEKNANWNGGSSFFPYSLEWTSTLKRSIRERDNYTCQICSLPTEHLFVHHIDYDKKNCNPKNLISLCNSCHTKTNHNRPYWIEFFKNNFNL